MEDGLALDSLGNIYGKFQALGTEGTRGHGAVDGDATVAAEDGGAGLGFRRVERDDPAVDVHGCSAGF